MRAPDPGRLLDRVGLGLAAAAAGWVLLAWARRGGDPTGQVVVLLASAGALLAARAVSSLRPWLVPLAVVVTAVALVLTDPTGVYSARPTAGPFGSSSLTAAFFLQAALAAALVATETAARAARVGGTLAAVAFAAVPFLTQTKSSAVVLALGAMAVGPSLRRARRGTGLLAAPTAFLLALATSVLLAATHRPGVEPSPIRRAVGVALTERRVAHWHDAYLLMTRHPTFGVGPGRYAAFSPTARLDPDAPWAHHEFLQQGAETGVAGFVLLAALPGWAFLRLAAAFGAARTVRRATPTSLALAALGVAALGIHGCLEHVLGQPGVAAVTAALVGAATARRSGRGTSTPA
ncbi:MAG TPA: O-antigen ligase family protein [Actinomycetota bacterium]|nr:O-antigen ligase family protein [Actinomycetota bacterium]